MKQVILVRSDLKLSRGKMSSQVSHASVEGVLKSDKRIIEKWRKDGMKKVILKVKDLDELLKYKGMADDSGLITALIRDSGRTEVEPGTVTCLAIGPDEGEKIDKITGKLKII
ncbi:MAG: peptidyl-tRNA hydrolase Pth2 [Nanoarchaeota archaeon]